jgi:GT2 family glycosyltransferase
MTAPATDNVAVVIVNHDAGEFLARSLACLAHQTLLPARIVVFDNASSDSSLAAARDVVARDARLAPRTVFEESGVNIGFAAANNRAVETCDTEFVALLNPDAFPEPGWLAALLDAARRYPAAAAFGSRQLLANSPALLDGVGDVYHVAGRAWVSTDGRRRTRPRDLLGLCGGSPLPAGGLPGGGRLRRGLLLLLRGRRPGVPAASGGPRGRLCVQGGRPPCGRRLVRDRSQRFCCFSRP